MRSCLRASAVMMFTLSLALVAWAEPPVKTETIGSQLIQRSVNDGDAGQVFIYLGLTQPFAQTGQASEWSFFDAQQAGRVVTPLLFQIAAPGQYVISGMGATRTSTGVGVQTFAFDLIAGSDLITSGQYTFGFTDRAYTATGGPAPTPGAANGGVVSADVPAIGNDVWRATAASDTGGPVTVQIGSILGSGGIPLYVDPGGVATTRTYSAQMTSIIPEPASLAALAGVASLLSIRHPRRRHE